LKKCRETQTHRHDVSGKQEYRCYADKHLTRVSLTMLNATSGKESADNE